MTRVLATGTFEILHPGHLYFFEQARQYGDELYVLVSRSENVRHKPKPVISDEQRCQMVGALRCVDHAFLGDKTDMMKPIREIRPDVIVLGFDQYFDEEKLRLKLAENGISAEIVRLQKLEGELCSSRRIAAGLAERFRKQSESDN